MSPHGTVRAFADDIGVLVPDPHRQLHRVAAVFRAVDATANLRLKVRKCRAIILAPDSDDPAAARRVRRIINDAAPTWSDLEVTTSGTHLGVVIGPGATQQTQWASSLTKLTRRAHAVADAGLSASKGFHEYGIRAAPTLGNQAQLTTPPDDLRKRDLRLRTRLAHAPFNAFSRSALLAPDHLGFRKTPPLGDMCYATLLRACSSTASSWRFERERLLRARTTGGGLLALAQPSALGAAMSLEVQGLGGPICRCRRETPE